MSKHDGSMNDFVDDQDKSLPQDSASNEGMAGSGNVGRKGGMANSEHLRPSDDDDEEEDDLVTPEVDDEDVAGGGSETPDTEDDDDEEDEDDDL